jgi:15-hydroxyprostaglandin dehydrogenase (NAD)
VLILVLISWNILISVAANAGMGESTFITEHHDVTQEPDFQTIDVNFRGPMYAAYLAIHYFRKNSPTGGRFIVTSSGAGLRGVSTLPLYVSTKHACVGLIHSLGANKQLINEGIYFNAICPGLVETPLASGPMMEYIKENMPQQLTPMSIVMRAFNICLESNLAGQILEAARQRVEHRPEYPGMEPEQDRLLDEVVTEFILKISKEQKS